MRRLLPVLLAFLLPLAAAAGTQPVTPIPQGATAFTCGVAGQAASLLQCMAPVEGRRYVITDIVAGSSTATAGTFAVQSGTGTNCATGTATVFPPPPMTTAARYVTPATSAVPLMFAPTVPLQVTSGHAICVIGVATNTANVVVSGWYTGP